MVTRIGATTTVVAALLFMGMSCAHAEDFRGFYFGANLGGAWGNSDASANAVCPANAATAYFCAAAVAANNGTAVSNQGSGSLSDDNVTGGVQAGYNAQSGGLVYGFEVDFSSFELGASRSGTSNYPTNPGLGAVGNTFTIGSGLGTNWLFTARGRFGWAVSHLLLYATGGLALTDLKTTATFRDNLAPAGFTPGASMFASNTDIKAGWTVGGGAEWVVHGNWTIRGEYLYVDFGSVTASGRVTNVSYPGGSNPLSISENLSAHIARAGVNYRFRTPH